MEVIAVNEGISSKVKKLLVALMVVSLVFLIFGGVFHLCYYYDYRFVWETQEYEYALEANPVTFDQVLKLLCTVAAPAVLLSFLLLYPAKSWARILLPVVYAFFCVYYFATFRGNTEGLNEVYADVPGAAVGAWTGAVIALLIPAVFNALGTVGALTGLGGKMLMKIPAIVLMVTNGLQLLSQLIVGRHTAPTRPLELTANCSMSFGFLFCAAALWILISKMTVSPVLPLFAKKKVN
jgi:hypothetical protein